MGLFAAGGMTQAVAQGGEAATGQSAIDEIIVTANKREQSLQDVAMSVIALTDEDLSAQGIDDLQALSFVVPGLLVAETGPFQRRISIRGIGNAFGSSSLVGMYVDESSVASVPTNQIDLRVYDLERIEVLKGPQGTLYGEGSVGGTIRYITKDPQLDGFSGKVALDASVTKDGDTSREFKSILNMPLTDTLGLRLVGQHISSGGWIDQPSLGKRDINDYELSNLRAKLLWEHSDNLKIKASAIVHKNDTGAQNIREDDNGNYQQLFDEPTTPSGTDDYELYNLTVLYDMEGMSLTSSTSYLDTQKQALNWGNECCFPTSNPGEYWNILIYEQNVSAEIFSQELRLSSDDSSALNWTAGIFYKDAENHP